MNSQFMHEAIQLARGTAANGDGGPFGAVIVRDDRIIGRGSNQVIATNDPTAHAEVGAIREACRALGTFHLRGAEIYTSCEPCPMCLTAIYWARLDRIYYALTRADAAAMGFDDDHFYRELSRPVCERQVPMSQVGRDAALLVLHEWQRRSAKTIY